MTPQPSQASYSGDDNFVVLKHIESPCSDIAAWLIQCREQLLCVFHTVLFTSLVSAELAYITETPSRVIEKAGP